MSGRKKKDIENDTFDEVTEKIDLNALHASVSEEKESDSEDEPDFAQDEEFPSEEPTEKIDLSELETKAAKKPRKPRKKAAKKADKPQVEKIEESEEIEAMIEVVEEVQAAPKKRRSEKKAKPEVRDEEVPEVLELEEAPAALLKNDTKDPSPSKVTLRRDASMASVAMQQSMDTMVKNWNSMKDATLAVSTNFERVAKMMDSVTGSYEESMKHVAKLQSMQKSRKPSGMSKAAMAVSAAAIIISLISLSFTQALRQTALNPKNVDSAKAATRMVDLPSKALAIQTETKVESTLAPVVNENSEKNVRKIKKTYFKPPMRSKK